MVSRPRPTSTAAAPGSEETKVTASSRTLPPRPPPIITSNMVVTVHVERRTPPASAPSLLERQHEKNKSASSTSTTVSSKRRISFSPLHKRLSLRASPFAPNPLSTSSLVDTPSTVAGESFDESFTTPRDALPRNDSTAMSTSSSCTTLASSANDIDNSNECLQDHHNNNDDDDDLGESLHRWIRDVDTLLKSPEMAALLTSSKTLAGQAAGTAAHVIMVPLTAPVGAVKTAAHVTTNTCGHALVVSREWVADHVLQPAAREGTSSSASSMIDEAIRHLSNAVPVVLENANHVKNGISGALLGYFAPRVRRGAGESRSDKTDNYLDRLRLDYLIDLETVDTVGSDGTGKTVAGSVADTTKYLLRTDDLRLSVQLCYMDFSAEFAEPDLTCNVLDKMVQSGLAFVGTNTETALQWHVPEDDFAPKIHWKAECNTAKLLKQKTRLSNTEWTDLLEKEILVWSGKYKTKAVYGHDLPFFLARGIVPTSPTDFMKLLWDNSRTSEYNRFCLERSNLRVLEDDNDRGTKLIKTETRVPFTSMTVVLSALMHVRKLSTQQTDDDDAYIIVSRSLNTGRAGHHTDHNGGVERNAQSEILWGVNVIRSVPGKPHMTDLTCLSQVNSCLVPGFLAHRVGMMAVENCFDGFRGK